MYKSDSFNGVIEGRQNDIEFLLSIDHIAICLSPHSNPFLLKLLDKFFENELVHIEDSYLDSMQLYF